MTGAHSLASSTPCPCRQLRMLPHPMLPTLQNYPLPRPSTRCTASHPHIPTPKPLAAPINPLYRRPPSNTYT
eukprot:234282-Chlamydomonas_euryale.AAC.2